MSPANQPINGGHPPGEATILELRRPQWYLWKSPIDGAEMKITTTSLLLICLAVLSACGITDDARTFENSGSFCVDDELTPGSTARLRVVFSECISACAEDRQTSCTMEERDGTYFVESSASYQPPRGTAMCPDVCATLSADCGEITVDDTEIVVVQGDAYHYLEPGSGPTCTPRQGEEPRPPRVFFDDPPGDFCLGEESGQLEPNTPFPIVFHSDQCLSTSCTTGYTGDCQIDIQGSSLSIGLSGSYGDASRMDNPACTDDCGHWTIECDDITLPEGTYTLSYGGDPRTFDVPSESGCY